MPAAARADSPELLRRRLSCPSVTRRPAIAAFVSVTVAAAALAAAACAWSPLPRARAIPDDEAPKAPAETAPKAPADHGPDVPAALPAGAVMPNVLTVVTVRPDVFAGRATALGRMVQCPVCTGTGTKVTRHRVSVGNMLTPKIVETKEDCPDCKGTGYCLNPSRVAPVLNSFVSLIGGLSADAPAATKQFERAREALCRLGSSGELAERITAQDRHEIASEHLVRNGSAMALSGVLGRSFRVDGALVVPVLVEDHAAILIRSPAINAAPRDGKVLVGGVVAGAVDKAEWKWGRVVVLDHGFVVPLTDPVHKGPGAAKDGGDAPPPFSGGGAAGGQSGAGAQQHGK
jgi:hypothetical protein